MNQFYRVMAQSETSSVPSQKAEGGQTYKSTIVLQEPGGKYENTYVATMLGNTAQCRFYAGELVVAALRFTTREYNGQVYQDIVVADIVKLN
mgnify:CR=1 FL=1